MYLPETAPKTSVSFCKMEADLRMETHQSSTTEKKKNKKNPNIVVQESQHIKFIDIFHDYRLQPLATVENW